MSSNTKAPSSLAGSQLGMDAPGSELGCFLPSCAALPASSSAGPSPASSGGEERPQHRSCAKRRGVDPRLLQHPRTVALASLRERSPALQKGSNEAIAGHCCSIYKQS